MHPVDESHRKRLLAWSALLCAVPICLAPLAGRSSLELASEHAAFYARFSAPRFEAEQHAPPITSVRDPFVPDVRSTGVPPPRTGIVGMHVTQGQPIGGLPVVTAVVTGASARALVDDGAQVHVVAVGDALAGSRVTSIDASGVRLQNGIFVPLSGPAR